MKKKHALLVFTVVTCISVFTLVSCGSRLGEDQQILIGKYTWESTGTSDGSIWTHDDPAIYDSMTTYTAGMELDNEGQIFLYKDGNVVTQSKYTILERESYDEHSAYIYIKLKNTDGLNLDDGKLIIRLSLDSNLTIDKFPFPAIDDVTDYYSDHTSLNNNFIKEY